MKPQPNVRWTEIRPGFTLMEMIVVITIVAIMSLVAYPLLKVQGPEIKLKSSSQELESLMERAKTLATNQQKPVRVIINCTRPQGTDSCYADLQTAVYTEDEVTGWQRHPDDRKVFFPFVSIVKTSADGIHDGEISVPNIYWAIFMPSSHIFSDPKGFDLFLYNNELSDINKVGWRLSVNFITGRVLVNQETFSVS